jgi:hypothetical protein
LTLKYVQKKYAKGTNSKKFTFIISKNEKFDAINFSMNTFDGKETTNIYILMYTQELSTRKFEACNGSKKIHKMREKNRYFETYWNACYLECDYIEQKSLSPQRPEVYNYSSSYALIFLFAIFPLLLRSEINKSQTENVYKTSSKKKLFPAIVFN